MAIKQIGNTGVYVIDVSNEQTNKTNYANLVSDLRWQLWNKVQDEQERLAKLDLTIWKEKADAIEKRRKALQDSRDRLAKGLKDAEKGNISINALISLAKSDATTIAAGERLAYSEAQKNMRFNVANDLKLALASTDETTLVDATDPVTGKLLEDSAGNIVTKQITKKGKTITIKQPKLKTDGTLDVAEKDTLNDKNEVTEKKGTQRWEEITIPIADAEALVGPPSPDAKVGTPTASGRMDAAARALGFKDTADFIATSQGKGAADKSAIQDELAKLDEEIKALATPSYTGRTGGIQDTRKAYASQMGVGGLFGMEPRPSRALPFFDEGEILPALESMVDKKMEEIDNKRAAEKKPKLEGTERAVVRDNVSKSLGRRLGNVTSPIDELPVAYPVEQGDFLKDRKTYGAEGESKIKLGFKGAPSQTFEEAYGGEPIGGTPPSSPSAPPSTQVIEPTPYIGPKVKVGELPSRPGILGATLPSSNVGTQVIEAPKASPSRAQSAQSDLDLYRRIIGQEEPSSIPTPSLMGGTPTVPSTQVIEKPIGQIATPIEPFRANLPDNAGPGLKYEPTPFATTEDKMKMDALRKKAQENKAPGILGDEAKAPATPQDRRAKYAVNVVKRATELAEKPKKFERIAKSELPEAERKKKVAEHILVADALFNTNKGKKNAFQAAYDELSRVYQKDTALREEAQAYLIAKNMLEENVTKPT